MNPPIFGKLPDKATDSNFDRLASIWAEFGVLADSRNPVSYDLIVGDNPLVPSTKNRPRGRIITFQSAVSDLFDVGLGTDGRWTINASDACTVQIIWF